MQTYRLRMEFHHFHQPFYFSVLSQFCLSPCTLIAPLWPGTVLNALMTWSDCQWSQQNLQLTEMILQQFAILLSLEVPPTVIGEDSFLGLSVLISFLKSVHSPHWSFDSIDWERIWSSFSLKNFISCLKAARALNFNSAIGQLLGRSAICKWLTASLYPALNFFARSFHPVTLNFESFRIPNIYLSFLSIAFDINVNKAVSLFASVPLLTRSSPLCSASGILSNLW